VHRTTERLSDIGTLPPRKQQRSDRPSRCHWSEGLSRACANAVFGALKKGAVLAFKKIAGEIRGAVLRKSPARQRQS
jgi:hypothetical protein